MLGDEATKLSNWLLCFRFTSEEIRVVIADLYGWMTNSSPLWDNYYALMACRLMALDKHPGVCPFGIGGTLHQDITKLVMRAAGDQEKRTCGSLQLCTGSEAGI